MDMEKNTYLAHRSEDGREQTIRAHAEGTAHLARAFAAPFGETEEAELAGIAAWQDGALLRHEDCILALNRLSSYFYLLQLRAATGAGPNGERNGRT